MYMVLKNVSQYTPESLDKRSIILICGAFIALFTVSFLNFFYVTIETRPNGLRLRRGGITYAYLRYARYSVKAQETSYAFFFMPRTRFLIECHGLDDSYNSKKKVYICHFFDPESFVLLSEEMERSKKSWLEGSKLTK